MQAEMFPVPQRELEAAVEQLREVIRVMENNEWHHLPGDDARYTCYEHVVQALVLYRWMNLSEEA